MAWHEVGVASSSFVVYPTQTVHCVQPLRYGSVIRPDSDPLQSWFRMTFCILDVLPQTSTVSLAPPGCEANQWFWAQTILIVCMEEPGYNEARYLNMCLHLNYIMLPWETILFYTASNVREWGYVWFHLTVDKSICGLKYMYAGHY